MADGATLMRCTHDEHHGWYERRQLRVCVCGKARVCDKVIVSESGFRAQAEAKAGGLQGSEG